MAIGATVRRDSRGFLEAPAYLTRVGVFRYRRADGTTVRELRHPDEVFHEDSLATLRAAPVTVGHPADFVSPDNAEALEVGVVGRARQDGKFVDGTVSIRRATAIAKVEKRELTEISLGYTCRVDATPGVFEGEAYDQVQRDIVYNHAAMLPPGAGRAGSDVRMRLDGDDAQLEETAPVARPESTGSQPAMEEKPMRKVRIDGIDYEIPDPSAAVVERLSADRDAQKKRADSAEGERDVMRGELATAQDPKRIQAAVQARVALERSASKVLGEERLDALTDREIKEKVLSISAPEFRCDGRSDDAVGAAFDYAMAKAKPKNEGLAIVKGAAEGTGGEVREDDLDAKIDELEKRRRNAHAGRAAQKGT